VLVVDDDPTLVDAVSAALRHNGFTVNQAATGRVALAQVREGKPDLMVLDVALPDMEGFEVARRLGAEVPSPRIIFLSERDEPSAKVLGLNLGADDYMTKPFSIDELLARVRSVLRRAGVALAAPGVLRFADILLDDAAHKVRRGNQPVALTATEYRLLRCLMLRAPRVLTRPQLLEHVWAYDFGGDAGVLETYISYLRRKLAPHGPPVIHTVRGVGYVLRPPP
jgi:two-component system OmpR family response regulator